MVAAPSKRRMVLFQRVSSWLGVDGGSGPSKRRVVLLQRVRSWLCLDGGSGSLKEPDDHLDGENVVGGIAAEPATTGVSRLGGFAKISGNSYVRKVICQWSVDRLQVKVSSALFELYYFCH